MEGIQHPPLVKRLQLNPVPQYHSCLQRKKAKKGEKKGKEKISSVYGHTHPNTHKSKPPPFLFIASVQYTRNMPIYRDLYNFIIPCRRYPVQLSTYLKHSVDLRVACGSKLNKLSFYSLSPKVFRINCRSFSDPIRITM